jgi:hypothetical protein
MRDLDAETRLASAASGALAKEYTDALWRMPFDDVLELDQFRIPRLAIATVAPAKMRIMRNAAGDRFCPNEAGDPAWCFPVRVLNPARPDEIESDDPLETVGCGAVIDLIAFHPRRRKHWALRTGVATVLGSIEPQYIDPAPVPVHRDVVSWLEAECCGVMLLTRDQHEARRILGQIRTTGMMSA